MPSSSPMHEGWNIEWHETQESEGKGSRTPGQWIEQFMMRL